METLNVTTFRKELSATLDRASRGEKVLIRRGNQVYALVSIGQEELALTPELNMRLEEAREAYRKGESHVCSSPEEIEDYLNSL